MKIIEIALDEKVMIGDDIQLHLLELSARKARIGFTAPPEVEVHRQAEWDQKRSRGER